MQRHLVVAALNWKPVLSGRVVEPLDVVGADKLEFSVFVHAMVCAAAE